MFKSKAVNENRNRLAIVLAILLWIATPVVVWLVWGTDQTESYLTQNALPVGLLFNFLVLVFLFHLSAKRTGRALGMLLIAALLWLVANPAIGRRLTALFENQYASRSAAEFDEPFRAVMMLGGCTSRLPSGHVQVNNEGQRVVATAALWHAQKTKWIVVTGVTDGSDGLEDAAKVSRQLLVDLGVPDDRIFSIPGRSTAHEMESMAEFLESPTPEFAETPGKLALVTSAFHMPRSMKLAAKNNLDFTPIPTGKHSRSSPWKPSDMVPAADTIFGNSILFRECLARLVGR